MAAGYHKSVLCVTVVLAVVGCLTSAVEAAHVTEPIETESTLIPPKGHLFVFTGYTFETNGEREHELPVEVEFGLTERTQLNLEGEVLILEENDEKERGVKELAFGLKQLLWGNPDVLHPTGQGLRENSALALSLDFAPVSRVSGDAQAFTVKLLASQAVGHNLLVHMNAGYELESRTISGERKAVNTALWRIAPMWQLVHDRLYAVGELVGERDFTQDATKLSFIPELIVSPTSSVSFKVGFAVGLTDATPDWGIRSGVSILF